MIVAEFKRWDGGTECKTIQRDWIDNIVCAVESQFTIMDKKQGLTIKGSDYSNVDIYEVEE